MALYKLDNNGEATRTDYDDYQAWLRGAPLGVMTLAQHDIVEINGVVVDVDALHNPRHAGKTIATIKTSLKPATGEWEDPWQTCIEGECEPRMKASTREAAWNNHTRVVNSALKNCGGRVLR